MTPQTVNAYYNPTLNEIVFPGRDPAAAVLRSRAPTTPSTTARSAPSSATRSATASTTRAASSTARGNLRDWWTADDRQRFEAKTKLLVEQYAAFDAVRRLHRQRRADAGREHRRQLRARDRLQGLSPLARRQACAGDRRHDRRPALLLRLCAGVARQGARRGLLAQIKSDPHSPDEFRVNGAVRNHAAFYATFGVKPGDALYLPPGQRVSIW